ncbi:MAG: glutamate cyclase domain-containing protein [Burkholderiaceae bacterium]
MLRTIASGTVRSTQKQLVSLSSNHPIKRCIRLYTSRHDSPEEAGNFLKQSKNKTLSSHPTFRHSSGDRQDTTPLATNVSPPLFINIEQSKQAFSEATWNRMSLITPLLMSFQARGIGNFVRESGAGNFNTAVHTLIQANRVLLCTGFNVAENMPETDGPLGTALLAYACFRADKYVALVADHHNAHLLRSQLFILDPACARNVVIEEVQANNQVPSGSWEAILERHQPDAVVHTEVPGRNKNGEYLNMRGIQISDFNAALDGIADLANARGLNTIGVGDGGNEAGMGQIKGVPKAPNMEEMQAVIPAAHQVIAWNSNLGAIAMGEFLMSAAGKGPSCTEEYFGRMLHALFKEGAVDGVTRGKKIDEKIENPAFAAQYNFTCVDGARSAIHIGNLLQVQDIAHNVPLTFPNYRNTKNTL